MILIAPSVLASTIRAYGNEMVFERITTNDGLSQNTVISILQDSKGFMWFGTLDGLSKYDGYRFTGYKHDPSDSTSLSGGHVLAIYEDRAGMLWICTQSSGLNRFDPETETFTRYRHDPLNPNSLANDYVSSIYEDSSGVFWIGTGRGLNQLSFNKDRALSYTFRRYGHDPGKPNSFGKGGAFSIYEDLKGLLWVGTNRQGVAAYDRKNEAFTHYKHDPNNPNSMSHNFAALIAGSDPGILWIGTLGGGLNKLVNSAGNAPEFVRYLHDPDDPNSLSDNRVHVVYKDRAKNLWIGTRKGLNKFDPKTESFIRFRHSPSDPSSLSNDVIFALCQDRAGVLWVGTLNGLNKSAASANKFLRYTHQRNAKNTLSHNMVNAIYEDKTGMIWVGTGGGGLNRFDPVSERFFRHYVHEPDNVNSLSGDNVHAVYEDHEEILWIGTEDGLNRLDPQTETFTRYKKDSDDANSISHNGVLSIHEDKTGTLWFGTMHGLNKFNRRTGIFASYVHIPGDSNSLSHSNIGQIFEDRAGMLWLAINGGGLNKFNAQTERFRRYEHNPKRPNNISNNWPCAIHEDNVGTLWIGTEAGLNRFDRETETFRHYSKKDGLASGFIWAILQDANGNLWLSTNKGISRFNPQTETFRNYDIHDGLSGNEFNAGAAFRSRTGEMYFGGRGLTRFHPDSIKDNLHVPPIVITDFQLFNESVPIASLGNSPLQKHISVTDEIALSYKENVFSFEFAALDYSVSSKNQYAYMMEGFDSDWVYSGTRRSATYTSLAPGQYRFLAKGSNNDGVWNDDGTSVMITIVPPWWQTRLFKTFAAIFLLGVVIISHKLRIRSLEARKQQLELLVSERTSELRNRTSELQTQKELAEKANKTIAEQAERLKNQANKLLEMDRLKSRFFANISHEFRTPLTLILGPVERMILTARHPQKRKTLNIVRRNARRLLRLVEQMLDLAKMETGKLQLQLSSSDFSAFLNGLKLSFVPWAERKNINLTFDAGSQPLTFYFDRDKLEKVLYNLLANAFKFTPQNGAISVAVEATPAGAAPEFIRIRISDTGIGIPADRMPYIFDRFYQVDGTDNNGGTGIGLAIAKELVELHGGDIHVQSEATRGTTFIVTLPMNIEDDRLPGRIEDKTDGHGILATDWESESYIVQLGTEEPEMHDHEQLIEQNSSSNGKQLPIVLLVEDNRDVRNYVTENLAANYKVVPSFDGADGLKKAIDIIPDLVIMDIMMPRIDGHELCHRLKNDERTSHIPLIMLTAKAAMTSKIKGLHAGIDEYLIKPFDMRELKARVENLIRQRRKLQEKFRREMMFKPHEIETNSPLDEAFLQKVHRVIEENLPDSDFKLERLNNEFHMSRSQLHRKTRALTGHAPMELIRVMRLNQAVGLLNKRDRSITEIAFAVGFNNLSYFAKCFRNQFGMLPSEYRKDLSKVLPDTVKTTN